MIPGVCDVKYKLCGSDKATYFKRDYVGSLLGT